MKQPLIIILCYFYASHMRVIRVCDDDTSYQTAFLSKIEIQLLVLRFRDSAIHSRLSVVQEHVTEGTHLF